MYVARKAFRNNGQMITPGSAVEPGEVKWFKTRLKDRVIVEVNAHNFDMWRDYFVGKFGVNITLAEQLKASIEAVAAEDVAKSVIAEHPAAEETPKVTVRKVIVKANS